MTPADDELVSTSDKHGIIGDSILYIFFDRDCYGRMASVQCLGLLEGRTADTHHYRYSINLKYCEDDAWRGSSTLISWHPLGLLH